MSKAGLFVLIGLLWGAGASAQPLRAEITTLGNDIRQAGGAAIYNRQHLSQLSVAKDLTRGLLVVDVTTNCKGCGGIHYLVRMFDRNGNYISHFVSESFIKTYGMQAGMQPGRKHLEFPVNLRDLREVEVVEFGFMPNLK